MILYEFGKAFASMSCCSHKPARCLYCRDIGVRWAPLCPVPESLARDAAHMHRSCPFTDAARKGRNSRGEHSGMVSGGYRWAAVSACLCLWRVPACMCVHMHTRMFVRVTCLGLHVSRCMFMPAHGHSCIPNGTCMHASPCACAHSCACTRV